MDTSFSWYVAVGALFTLGVAVALMAWGAVSLDALEQARDEEESLSADGVFTCPHCHEERHITALRQTRQGPICVTCLARYPQREAA